MKRPVLISQKLIGFLQEEISSVCSGKMLRRVLEANLCRVNGRIERFGSTQLKKGDIVELASHWQSAISSSAASQFKILYEDDAVKVVDKPAGWVCSEENCLRTFKNCFLVHRLDKDTTGVLVLAKHKMSRDGWMERFAKREVKKQYLAVVDGIPKEDHGVRESSLVKKKTFQGQTIWGSGHRGLHALTHWRTLATGKDSSLLLCEPVTGRTHQIRVHLAEMGHPILIDRQYSDRFRSSLFARRPLLHAWGLSAGTLSIQSPMPVDMQEALDSLRINVGHLCELFAKEQHDDSRNHCNDDKDAEKIRKGADSSH